MMNDSANASRVERKWSETTKTVLADIEYKEAFSFLDDTRTTQDHNVCENAIQSYLETVSKSYSEEIWFKMYESKKSKESRINISNIAKISQSSKYMTSRLKKWLKNTNSLWKTLQKKRTSKSKSNLFLNQKTKMMCVIVIWILLLILLFDFIKDLFKWILDIWTAIVCLIFGIALFIDLFFIL